MCQSNLEQRVREKRVQIVTAIVVAIMFSAVPKNQRDAEYATAENKNRLNPTYNTKSCIMCA